MGSGNTVGVILYAIGGGISFLTGIIGFASVQILGAKIIAADGRLVNTSEDVEPDLLWAIRGAGQFFGVVLELTLKTYLLSHMGTLSGAHWVGRFGYPLDKAVDIGNALESLMVTTKHNTCGVVMVAAPPPAFQLMLLVAAHYIGDPSEAPDVFQSLFDIGPIMLATSTPLLPEFSNSIDHGCAKGDFKHFSLVGMTEFKTKNLLEVIDIFKELHATCPDAHAILDAVRADQRKEDYIDYPNCNRTDPIELRYKGEGRLERLRTLKLKWDPKGVFTRQLLD